MANKSMLDRLIISGALIAAEVDRIIRKHNTSVNNENH